MLCELSIVPLGVGTSVSRYVARAVAIIRESGLPHEFHAMGTNLEGDYDQIVAVVKACKEALFAMGAERVTVRMYLDERRDRPASLGSKKASVENKLGV